MWSCFCLSVCSLITFSNSTNESVFVLPSLLIVPLLFSSLEARIFAGHCMLRTSLTVFRNFLVICNTKSSQKKNNTMSLRNFSHISATSQKINVSSEIQHKKCVTCSLERHLCPNSYIIIPSPPQSRSPASCWGPSITVRVTNDLLTSIPSEKVRIITIS